MPTEKELVGKVLDQSGGVLEKAYDDLAHPTAKSLGNTASLIPRTIGVWLGKWEKWVINGEESIRLAAQAVQEKASRIPEEKLTEPEPYVAIPAVQQLSYCYDSDDLREMYANLLVASMNSDTKWAVHPSYVDIIKQLTPDEAKLLKLIAQRNSLPIVDINLNVQPEGYHTVVHNFSDIIATVCDMPQNATAYFDNLSRLKLVDIPSGVYLVAENAYTSIENHPKVTKIMKTSFADGSRPDIKKKLVEITEFGKAFCKVCL